MEKIDEIMQNCGFRKKQLGDLKEELDKTGAEFNVIDPLNKKFISITSNIHVLFENISKTFDHIDSEERYPLAKDENKINRFKEELSNYTTQLVSILSSLTEFDSELNISPEKLVDDFSSLKDDINNSKNIINEYVDKSKTYLGGFVDTNSDLVNMVPEDHSLDGAIKVDSIEPVKQGQNEAKSDSETDLKKAYNDIFKEKAKNKDNIDGLNALNANFEPFPISNDWVPSNDFVNTPVNTPVSTPVNTPTDNNKDSFDISDLFDDGKQASNQDVEKQDIDKGFVKVTNIQAYNMTNVSQNSNIADVSQDDGKSRALSKAA